MSAWKSCSADDGDKADEEEEEDDEPEEEEAGGTMLDCMRLCWCVYLLPPSL